MRGQKSLFSDLFHVASVKKEKQRPRNYFQPERNQALVHRYYYHAEINRLRYDDCLLQLEKEFYLTTPRLIVILTESSELLNEVALEKPSVKELENKFPHFTWKNLSRVA
ncbi:MAG: hypothetical protein H0X62_14990 [Bacteroidetes bacterium]|jgi:hypothetical protein|nr:hypothetical protein [Bacteroidota bacterium]